MGLFLALLWCASAAEWGANSRNSRLGGFNSRLGLQKSRLGLLREFTRSPLITLTLFPG
jgi:hypothetical protein